ncbi:MAG: hypothetical protein HUU20_19750, partial [Pirellulales bacterium]|nr:hypothetical protein [Pirellulales bacterium]
KSGRTSFLASELSKRHHDVDLEDLSALGLQLLEELEASSLQDTPALEVAPDPPVAAPAPLQPAASAEPVCRRQPAPELAQAHSAHSQFCRTAVSAAAASRVEFPSNRLETVHPASHKKLKQLDNLVYEAVCGSAAALEQLRGFWPTIHEELGNELLNRSREAYLRYAITVWEDRIGPEKARDPDRAVQALDVICVLFDEA